jgi:RNA polymerase Rpb2, domain 6/RNA polymerase Rpb1, domain 2/RNA polymerase Rpb2, domain 3
MPIDMTTPWHKASFDQFLGEGLPRLLAERLPLAGYRVEPEGTYTCRVTVIIATGGGELPLLYSGFPQPDAQGIFEIDGGQRIVIPLASTEELDMADVRCAGEQLYDYIAERLGQAPAQLPWDEALARAWLPLDAWARDFLTPDNAEYASNIKRLASWPDQTNWLALRTHLRRLVVRERQRLFTPGQLGRTCPFEVPEGPNMGHIFTIAAGAAIRDRRLVVLDDRPAATLGLSASMIPFLEHNEPPRLLMGANMLRQWLPPPDPEPALVQTGNEPDAPEFWCGRNLLTAFVSWDGDTFEDGIVISESCARRLGYPRPVEPGDKFSNRHGAKGVISRILPDDQMPHLADGTPVELLFSFMSLPSRMNFGQVREAVMGRIARAEGRPAIVPPFHAPSADELRERLARAGLPTDGMELLTHGRGGPPLARPSTVGWVYWGKLVHVASDKLRIWTGEPGDTQRGAFEDSLVVGAPPWPAGHGGQRQGELEYYALRQAGAVQTITEQYNTRAADRADAGTIAARLAAGPVAQAGAPSPMFAGLARRLAAGGIRADLGGERLTFNFALPAGDALHLARHVAHPWLPERSLDTVGALPDLPEYAALVEANARLARLVDSQAPAALAQQALANLEARVGTLFETLLRPEHLRFDQRTLFSARAVAAPGADLPIDRVGLADEIAWRLFGPLLVRELGDREAARLRDDRAAQALDRLMERSWVIVNRAPSIAPHTFLAFRPLRIPDRVIRLPLLACNLLDADFDGDQLAVFLPITEAGQHEAAERLTVAAHLARDPGLLEEPRPRMDALLGLALLSLTSEGRAEIDRLAGTPVPTPDGFVTRWTVLDAMRAAMDRGGPPAALELSQRLMWRGFEVARASGASIGPFVGAELRYPPAPRGDDPAAWDGYVQELIERIAAHAEFSGDFGVLALAAKSGARTNLRQIAWTIGARGAVTDVAGRAVAVRHGYRDGLEPGELFALVAGARAGIHELLTEWERMGRTMRERMGPPRGYGALARAMRSPRPGVVFALAAAAGEVDPLVELDSRLFVGLPSMT